MDSQTTKFPLAHGRYHIMKRSEGGHVYRTIVMDVRDRSTVYVASKIGWTKAMKEECIAWLNEHSEEL